VFHNEGHKGLNLKASGSPG